MVRVLFLGGLGRSGTTLMERVLGALPGVCPLGEVVHLWRRDILDDERCGCGDRFSACGFWRAVGDEAFGGWHRLDLDRLLELQRDIERTRHIPRLSGDRSAGDRFSGDWGARVREYAGYYARVYTAAARVSGAELVVDSSKHSALAFCLRWLPEAIDLRVAHVVRDARGVAYSWTKTVRRPDSDGRDDMTRYSPGRTALLWTAHNAAFTLLARRGVAVKRFRYEEFVADPRAVTRQLAQFAGLAQFGGEELPADALDFLDTAGDAPHAMLPTAHTAAGNPIRFATGRVALRRDDAWEWALPASQRRVVATIAAPMLGLYGYRLLGRRSDGARP